MGGKTDLDNGALLCRRHHGLAHGHNPWKLQAVATEDLPSHLRDRHTAAGNGAAGNGRGCGRGNETKSRGTRLIWHTPDGGIIAAQTAADHRPTPPPPDTG